MSLIIVTWWMYCYKSDGYDNYDEQVEAGNEEDAIKIIKKKYPRGKDFKVWK